MINEAYELVKIFQSVAGQPVSTHPRKLSEDRVSIRIKWMEEEIQEFKEAEDVYSQADALTDLLYYLLGAYVEIGIKPDALFDLVHKTNMMKLTSCEGIIKSKDGKVQKPSDWKHPDVIIKRIIDDS